MSIAKPVEPKAEFYGVIVAVNTDGSEDIEYCGGYSPQPLSPGQLRPWLILAQKSLEKDGLWPTDNIACTAG